MLSTNSPNALKSLLAEIQENNSRIIELIKTASSIEGQELLQKEATTNILEKSENNCNQHKTEYKKIKPGNTEKVEIATDHAQITGDYWKLPESVI